MEVVAALAGEQDCDPLPPRTAAAKRRDPAAWPISEGDPRALEPEPPADFGVAKNADSRFRGRPALSA